MWPIVTQVVIITSRNEAFWIWLTHIGLPRLFEYRKHSVWFIAIQVKILRLSEYFMSTSNSSKLVFKISEIWVEWIVIFFVKWIHFWTLLQLLLFSCWQLYFWGYFKIYIWYLSFFLRKINYALPLTIFGSFAWSAPNGWGRFSCNFTEKFLHV